MLHVDYFISTITEKGRSKIIEDASSKTIRVDESLLVLASVEKQDEANPENISKKAVEEISRLAKQLKINTIVLHPFAHLFRELSKPEIAISTLKLIEGSLAKSGFKVIRTPFGWFNTLELKAKGHPLSRVSRMVSLN